MILAIAYDNGTGEVFQHFGRTEFFKVYKIDGNRIAEAKVVSTNGEGHGALAGVLAGLGADTLICGGIGGGAQMAIAQMGIKLYGGVQGKADDVAKALLDGRLEFDPDVQCNHHEHGHEGHTCSCGGGCHH